MDDDRVGARGPLQLGGAGTDQGWTIALRVASRSASEKTIEPSFGRSRVPSVVRICGAERVDDGREPGCPRLDDLTGDPVRVDQHGPVSDEQP